MRRAGARLVGIVLALAAPAHAAVIVVETTQRSATGTLCNVGDALDAANGDVQSGGCTETLPSGADVVDLSGLTGTIAIGGDLLPVIQEDVTLRGPGANLLTIDGGGLSQILVVAHGTLTVEGLTIANGSTGGRGGCIALLGAGLVLRDSRVTGCDAFNGGAIAVDDGSTARIERSLIDANTAGNSGAGVIVSTSTAEIDDSTFSGNVAQQAGGGIAVFGADGGGVATTARIHSSTFADNGGGTGGGNLYTASGDPAVQTLLTHVLLAAPQSGGNCGGGAVTSQGWNLATDASCALAATGDLPNAIADITSTLTDIGGTTAAHALLPGSAAIDGGNPAGCTDATGAPLTVDQRGAGFPRRTDGNLDGSYECDIGAIEAAPEPGASLAGAACCLALAIAARVRRRG